MNLRYHQGKKVTESGFWKNLGASQKVTILKSALEEYFAYIIKSYQLKNDVGLVCELKILV